MRAALFVVTSVATLSCTPPKPSKDVSLDLVARLENASPGERDRMVREAIERNGGTPLVEGDSALFLVEGSSDGPPPRLLADFNGWGEPEDRLAEAAMTLLEGTSWYYLERTLDPRARIEYAIARESTEDDALHLDPENPRTVEGFSRSYSELRMPAYPDAPELLDDPSIPRGRLVETEIESRIRGNRRKILVYLPAGYEDGDRRYPTAYFGDGSDYVSRVPVPRILDYVIARGGVRPLVGVFIEPMPRSEEYRMNEDYGRFVAEELVPWIDSRYRTIDSAEARAVLGGSRGGLAAADVAYSHADTFGACGAIAPAASPTNLIDVIAQGEVKPVRFFVLVGLYDLDWRPDGIALYDVLRSKGYDVEFLEIPEGHSWNAWKSYIDDVLMVLFPAERRTS
jgi:enterochelin esterase family protein